MLNLAQTTYRLVLITENNKQYNIKNYVTGLKWEENENEIASRISFTVRNDKTSKGRLSTLLKPGCLIGVFARTGKKEKEVARGYVTDWNPNLRNSANSLKCTCYDLLFHLQKSQDNRYYPAGTGTKSIITGILKDWNIPMKSYHGPDVAHGKLKYNNSYVSDMLLDVLDDAHKKGAGRYFVRMEEGYADIVGKGTNQTIYVFKADVMESVDTRISTTSLVTRVKVVGQADDEGRTSVEASLDGLTKYGIRQRIYTRGTDESFQDAKSAAQELLNEDGVIQREITLQAPDVAFIRKGDLVYVMAGVKDGYYFVKSIQHNCESSSMSMELKYAGTGLQKETKSSVKAEKEYNVGDVVHFKGGIHYISSYPGAKGYEARAGNAKITQKEGSGKAHPWHLIHTDSESNVYGWVDDGTFE